MEMSTKSLSNTQSSITNPSRFPSARGARIRSIQKVHPRSWISESYAVKFSIVSEILFQFGLSNQQFDFVDVFKNVFNNRFPKFFVDAWSQDWHDHWLWINPPFSCIDKMVVKLICDRGKGIVVIPAWRIKSWFKVLLQIACAHCFVPPGNIVFELNGMDSGPRRWGTYFLFINGFSLCSSPRKTRQDLLLGVGHKELISLVELTSVMDKLGETQVGIQKVGVGRKIRSRRQRAKINMQL